MLRLVIILSLLFIISVRYKFKPYLTLITSALISGLLLEMNFLNTLSLVFVGFKNILFGIGPLILIGTLLGKILMETGSTRKMVDSFFSFFGLERIPVTLNIFGFILSIPVFCDAAFIIMSSIIKEISKTSGKNIIILAVCLATGLYSAHVFVPPTPGPIAAAAILKADIGLLLIVGLFTGLIVSIAGFLWIKFLFKKDFKIKFQVDQAKYFKKNTSLYIFLPIIIPVTLISLSTIIKYPSFNFQGTFLNIISFTGRPDIALIIGVFTSSLFIDNKKIRELPSWVYDSLKKSLDIILITGAGGAFGYVIRSSQIIDSISLDDINGVISIITVFLIAALIKTIQGSSTVALITTCALISPIIESSFIVSEIQKVILVISIGSGAMMISHVNDSYFWVISKYSNISMSDTIKFFTTATIIQGITGLIISITLFIFLT